MFVDKPDDVLILLDNSKSIPVSVIIWMLRIFGFELVVYQATSKGNTEKAQSTDVNGQIQKPALERRKGLVWSWESTRNGAQSLSDDHPILLKGHHRRSVFPAHPSHFEIFTLLLRLRNRAIR